MENAGLLVGIEKDRFRWRLRYW